LSWEASEIIFLCFFSWADSIYLSRSSQQKKNLKQEFCVRCTNKIFYHQLRIQLYHVWKFQIICSHFVHWQWMPVWRFFYKLERGKKPVLWGESQVLCPKYLHLAASVYVIYCKELHSERAELATNPLNKTGHANMVISKLRRVQMNMRKLRHVQRGLTHDMHT
jgi:hypothetical protein